jgi:hypothetical protein
MEKHNCVRPHASTETTQRIYMTFIAWEFTSIRRATFHVMPYRSIIIKNLLNKLDQHPTNRQSVKL